MALKRKIDTLDGLDESLHSLYRENGDGYVLDLEGDDDTALRRALEHERRQRREATEAKRKLEEQLAALESQPATPTQAPGESHDDFKARVEAATKPLREQMEQLKKRYEEAENRAKQSEIARKRSDVLTRARQAASQHVREDLLDDFLAARVERLFDFDEEAGEFVPKRNGELIYDADDPGRPASPEAVIAQILADKSAAPYRRPSRGVELGEAGSFAGNSAFVLSPADARDPQKYQRARELAAKQGKEVAIAG